MDSVAPPGLSMVSVLSLLACSIQLFVAVMLTRRYGGRSSTVDWWILLWLFYDVIVHLTLVCPTRSRNSVCLHVCDLFAAVFQEGPFVYMSVVGTVETSEGPLAQLCEFS